MNGIQVKTRNTDRAQKSKPTAAAAAAAAAAATDKCIRFLFVSGSTCDNFQRWKKENGQVDALYDEWARWNTKACPKCHQRIEKNQGCDHMTCRCGYEFYWTTLQPYRFAFNFWPQPHTQLHSLFQSFNQESSNQ
jgi:hypothetical protein